MEVLDHHRCLEDEPCAWHVKQFAVRQSIEQTRDHVGLSLCVVGCLGHLQDRSWWKVGDVYLLVANQYDHARSRLEIEYTFISNGRVDVRCGSHQAYSFRALVQLLESAGFAVELDQPWTRDAHNVMFIATRK